MLYADILKNAEKHMTKKYDSAFAAAKIPWYPWVGENYHMNGILILGINTYYKDKEGKEWSDKWKQYCESTSVNPSRVLVSECLDNKQHRPFKAMSAMFLDEAGKDSTDGDANAMFWESVAFNNHYHKIIPFGDSPDFDDSTQHVFYRTLDILKPKLCMAWTTDLTIFWPNYRVYDKISGAYPRVADQRNPIVAPPIVGVRHPSRGFGRADWLRFLRTHPASKDPIGTLLEHLRNHPTK